MDRAVSEISATRPALRAGVKILPRYEKGERLYLLEDPVTGKYFELGASEREILRRLNGTRTIGEVIAASVSGPESLGKSEAEVTALIRMLSEADLLETTTEGQAQRNRKERLEKREEGMLASRAKSLFFLKVPLGNPDRLLAAWNRWLSPVPGWLFAGLWLGLVGWGVFVFLGNSEKFFVEAKSSWQMESLLGFVAAWLALKLVHEISHGLMCKRFGGVVPEAGVVLLLFVTPLAYVDASSSVSFPSKWRRIAVSAAGMLVEFLVAAVAVVIWSKVDPGALSATLQKVITISTVVTLVFNANPLMRFDGYYILSDLVGISNLYQKGRRQVSYQLKRWLLGVRNASSPLSGMATGQRWLIGIYGWLALIWRGFVMLGLFVAAWFLFEGAGRLVAAIVALGMVISWTRSIRKYFRRSAGLEQTNIWKMIPRVALVGLAFGWFLFGFKFDQVVVTPAVVDAGNRGDLRIECPGFVEEIAVRDGALVREGDLILKLRNDEATLYLDDLRRELAASELRAADYLKNDNIAAYQAEKEGWDSLRSKLEDQEIYVDTLLVRAPFSGQLVARHFKSLQGGYLDSGTVAARVIKTDAPEVQIAIPQAKLPTIGQLSMGDSIEFLQTKSGKRIKGQLIRVRPEATVEVPHPGLSQEGGGPLAVRHSGESGEGILAMPHLIATASIASSPGLREGQLLEARLGGGEALTPIEWIRNRVAALVESTN